MIEIKKIIRHLRIFPDQLTIRTRPMGKANQALWGKVVAQRIYTDAVQRQSISGRMLWNRLPEDMQSYVTDTRFDPYHKGLNENELYRWLWQHVIFDKSGDIIAIHDCGKIITCKEGWEEETGWFSRVRLADELTWEVVDGS